MGRLECGTHDSGLEAWPKHGPGSADHGGGTRLGPETRHGAPLKLTVTGRPRGAPVAIYLTIMTVPLGGGGRSHGEGSEISRLVRVGMLMIRRH